MLSDIEAGHINCVIVKDLSRLGRNSIDTGYYIEQYFHAHNVLSLLLRISLIQRIPETSWRYHAAFEKYDQ